MEPGTGVNAEYSWETKSGLIVTIKGLKADESHEFEFKSEIAGYIVGIGASYAEYKNGEPFEIQQLRHRIEHTRTAIDKVRVVNKQFMTDGDGDDAPQYWAVVALIAWRGAASNLLLMHNFDTIENGTSSPPASAGVPILAVNSVVNGFEALFEKGRSVRWLDVSTSASISSDKMSVTAGGSAKMQHETESGGNLNVSVLAQLHQLEDIAIKTVEIDTESTDRGKNPVNVSIEFEKEVLDAIVVMNRAKLDYVNKKHKVSQLYLGAIYTDTSDNTMRYRVSWSGKTVRFKTAPTMYRNGWGWNKMYESERNIVTMLVIAKLRSAGEEAKAGECDLALEIPEHAG